MAAGGHSLSRWERVGVRDAHHGNLPLLASSTGRCGLPGVNRRLTVSKRDSYPFLHGA